MGTAASVACAVALGVVALVGGMFAVRALESDTGWRVIDLGSNAGPAAPAAPADIAKAAAVVSSSGELAAISGGQATTIEGARSYEVNGHALLHATVSWERPVESDGPWVLLRCRGTRLWTVTGRWSGLRTLDVVIDLGSRALVAYGVGTKSLEMGARREGEVVEVNVEPDCPRGLADD